MDTSLRNSLFNFTNPDSAGSYPSQNCAVNGLNYGESVPFQEVINTTQEFQLAWVSVHSFHHHVNPCVPASDLPARLRQADMNRGFGSPA